MGGGSSACAAEVGGVNVDSGVGPLGGPVDCEIAACIEPRWRSAPMRSLQGMLAGQLKKEKERAAKQQQQSGDSRTLLGAPGKAKGKGRGRRGSR